MLDDEDIEVSCHEMPGHPVSRGSETENPGRMINA